MWSTGVALEAWERVLKQSDSICYGDAIQAGSIVAGLTALSLLRIVSRKTRVARASRVVVVENENTVPLDIPSGTIESMDAFMAQHSHDVILQNLEKMEDKPGEPDVKYCYTEPTDVGPWRTQMRLTVRIELPESGRCDVKVLNIENGSVDKSTGNAVFPEPKDSVPFKFQTENTITWSEDASGALKVLNYSKARSETTLPFWFPLPDKMVQVLSSALVKGIITSGQKKAMEQMEKQFQAWQQQRA